ncbi:MAG: M20/M25/M40 family metallo-hydrolase [Balneolales bacterium]
MNLLTANATDILKKLVSFDSLSSQEKKLVDWLEGAVRETNALEIERHGDNLIFHLGSGKPWLLLNSHSDVVPPSPNHYGEPFAPVEKDGKIYGRGTTDAKGCGTGMLKALLELSQEGFLPNGRVSFALTVCEETCGAGNGMDYLRGIIEKPDAAIIGEPTTLAPCIAQKGLYILKVITTGVSGHAARVEGKNALYEMSTVLEKLKTIFFDTENPFIGKTKITPTVINGGTVKNAYPERCELMVDIRTVPEVSTDMILEKLTSELNAEIEVMSNRLVSTQTDASEKIAQAALKASGQEFFGSPTASDWVFLKDVPAVKIGPGHSQVSHTRDECIEIDQLQRGVQVYKDIIRNYFS